MPHSNRPRFESAEDGASVEYRAVSGLAIGGLLLGLLSAVAIFHPSLCLVALVALVVNVLALRKIAGNPSVLVGRKAALVGMTLAVACATVGSSHWYASRWFIRREAQRFGAIWFEALARNEPHVAAQYSMPPTERWPLDKGLINRYVDEPDKLEQLQEYTDMPDVRALLALGEEAEVRFYNTEHQGRRNGEDTVLQVYAVSYSEAGARKTFFVALSLSRLFTADADRAQWWISDHNHSSPPAAGGLAP